MEVELKPEFERFRTILVATDFSRNAHAALDWAIEIARGHGGSIVLAHAIDAVSMASIPVGLQQKVADSLAVLERIAQDAGVEATSKYYNLGKTWEALREAEAEFTPDLLVVGARGHTVYSRLLLGSTADRVVRAAGVPVLVVHPTDAGRESAIKMVVVATDFSEEAALATSAAVRLVQATARPSQVVLLHVSYLPETYVEAGAPAVVRACLEHEDEIRRKLETLAAPLRSPQLSVDVVVKEGYPATVIEEQARVLKADLVALGTHGRGGLKHLMLGSIAERVLHHAPCPVLTVRQPVADQPVGLAAEPGVREAISHQR